MPKISVVEFGIGNIYSVTNAFARVGCKPLIARDGDELLKQSPDKIVLPGVGAIGEAFSGLKNRGFVPVINEMISDQKIHVLGICVGMQIMAETCEEFGLHQTLGWIPGRVRRIIPDVPSLHIPHVGWNNVTATTDDRLLKDVSGEHFYFTHSCAFECDEEYVIGRFEYGKSIICAVRLNNIYGVQFHPEKSSGKGEKVLAAFVNE